MKKVITQNKNLVEAVKEKNIELLKSILNQPNFKRNKLKICSAMEYSCFIYNKRPEFFQELLCFCKNNQLDTFVLNHTLMVYLMETKRNITNFFSNQCILKILKNLDLKKAVILDLDFFAPKNTYNPEHNQSKNLYPTYLHLFAQKQNENLLLWSYLLKEIKEVNTCDILGFTPLLYMQNIWSLKVAKKLYKNGADYNLGVIPKHLLKYENKILIKNKNINQKAKTEILPSFAKAYAVAQSRIQKKNLIKSTRSDKVLYRVVL